MNRKSTIDETRPYIPSPVNQNDLPRNPTQATQVEDFKNIEKGMTPNGNRYGLYVYNLKEPTKHIARRGGKKANTEKRKKEKTNGIT